MYIMLNDKWPWYNDFRRGRREEIRILPSSLKTQSKTGLLAALPPSGSAAALFEIDTQGF